MANLLVVSGWFEAGSLRASSLRPSCREFDTEVEEEFDTEVEEEFDTEVEEEFDTGGIPRRPVE